MGHFSGNQYIDHQKQEYAYCIGVNQDKRFSDRFWGICQIKTNDDISNGYLQSVQINFFFEH